MNFILHWYSGRGGSYIDENITCSWSDCSHAVYCGNQVDQNCEILKEMPWRRNFH